MADEQVVAVRTQVDIVVARQTGRQMAAALGFFGADLTLIATAISEIARNLIEHAGEGMVRIARVHNGIREGLQVTVTDQGPGIADIARAMEDGYSTGQGLGLGLPGARRLMDEFELQSQIGKGTRIVMRKWIDRHG